MDPTEEEMIEGPAIDTPTEEGEEQIQREPPEITEARKQLVTLWCERVVTARDHWTKLAFNRMREDLKFAAGDQWPAGDDDNFVDVKPERYVANVVMRHIAQRTASIYGKNPRTVARRRKRLLSTVWDGSQMSLINALQQIAQAQTVGLDPAIGAPDALMLLLDAQQTIAENQKLDKIAKTLELLYEWNVEEQVQPFKQQMKGVVRRTLATGVGYVKLGFQRIMQQNPDVERQLADFTTQLATVERLAADLADGEIDQNAAEAEQLRINMRELSKVQEIVVREGLTFDYPESWSVIPDTNCKQLRGFIGSDWVAEEYLLTADKIKEIYKIDVGGSGARTYSIGGSKSESLQQGVVRHLSGGAGSQSGACADERFAVWEIYSKSDRLVYTVCDGYPDFLTEPTAPDPMMERFYPWFAYVTNESFQEGNPYPVSEVFLIRDMQLEINRARQGLREHRRANRPKTAVAAGTLDDTDKAKLEKHPANAVIELNGLQPNQNVNDVLQAVKGAPIDPALYDTSPPFEDILRVVGAQEANLGGTSSATATESSIAESSRMTAQGSMTDDLDEMLTEMSRVAGQILLSNVSVATVKKVVGPGAVWPELTAEDVMSEIYLEIEAASTGRPNKAQEVQNATQIMPILLQIPNISPEWIARELIRRLDDRLDLTDAFAPNLPSIAALNRMPAAGPPAGNDPNAQGDQGAENSPNAGPKQNNVAPRTPGPRTPEGHDMSTGAMMN